MPRPVRAGTVAQWAAENPVLGDREFAIETDTGITRVGDGFSAYGKLAASPTFKLVGQRDTWDAPDHGYIAWAFDPALAVNGVILGTAGTVSVVRLHVPVAATVTNVVLFGTTAGGTLTASQCMAGLYQGGNLIGTTASQATNWQTAGLYTMPLTGGPFQVNAGDVYVAFFANGTTLPSFATAGGATGYAIINAGIAATASRFGTADTGRTTTLASSLGTIAAAVTAYWAALS